MRSNSLAMSRAKRRLVSAKDGRTWVRHMIVYACPTTGCPTRINRDLGGRVFDCPSCRSALVAVGTKDVRMSILLRPVSFRPGRRKGVG